MKVARFGRSDRSPLAGPGDQAAKQDKTYHKPSRKERGITVREVDRHQERDDVQNPDDKPEREQDIGGEDFGAQAEHLKQDEPVPLPLRISEIENCHKSHVLVQSRIERCKISTLSVCFELGLRGIPAPGMDQALRWPDR